MQATALRFGDRALFTPPVIVTNAELETAVADQLAEIGVEMDALILEPTPRGTAPAAAIAALMLANNDADAVVAILPSDHAISDDLAFTAAMKTAAKAAKAGALATFGIPPSAPETGYGYIRQGRAHSEIDDCFHLDAFVEKPDRETATRYLAAGDYLWNSGMFVFSARSYLRELERLEPAILDACRSALPGGVRRGGTIDLDRQSFEAFPTHSIDRAVMERTSAAVVIPVDLGWSDIGAWAAVWEIGEKDGLANVVFGEVALANVEKCLIYNESSSCLEVTGVVSLVVVSTAAAVFIAERARSADVGALVTYLGAESADLPVADASVQVSGGIQIVRIGCQDVQVVTTPETVRVSGGKGDSVARD